MKSRSNLIHDLIMLAILIGFLLFSVRNLTIVPVIFEDEPWLASTGWKLAQTGMFGTDLMTGFYGMESHYYGFLPLYSILLSVVFKLFGLGMIQAFGSRLKASRMMANESGGGGSGKAWA